MKNFLVYEVRNLNVFADEKKHVSYILCGEFKDLTTACNFIAENSSAHRKFILREG